MIGTLATRATTETDNMDKQIAVGDRVRIERVAFPDSPSHARFIGNVGTVTKMFKTRPTVKVEMDTGKVRYCYPWNLSVLEDYTDEIERLMGLPYTIKLKCGDDGWFVQVEELPGCMSQGNTGEEAVAMIQEAMRLWFEVALEDGDQIPEPQ